jgi:hypothetical protein
MDDQPALVELRTVGARTCGGGLHRRPPTRAAPRRRWCIAVIIPSLRACPCAWPAAVAEPARTVAAPTTICTCARRRRPPRRHRCAPCPDRRDAAAAPGWDSWRCGTPGPRMTGKPPVSEPRVARLECARPPVPYLPAPVLSFPSQRCFHPTSKTRRAVPGMRCRGWRRVGGKCWQDRDLDDYQAVTGRPPRDRQASPTHWSTPPCGCSTTRSSSPWCRGRWRR